MKIARTITELQEATAGVLLRGERLALVPTMGALHEGHLQLVRYARQYTEHVFVSIFINPTQFGPNEDYERYPRQEEQDIKKLKEEGVEALWLPAVDVMYPEGFSTSIHVRGITERLCGASRPGHFDGVATIVAKLLIQTMPDIAIFGEKDYQQLQLIRRLTQDLNLPVHIAGMPTVREPSGLALSSRNTYLSEEGRKIAPALYATLQNTAKKIQEKYKVVQTLGEGKRALKDAGFTKIDYLEYCHSETLQPLTEYTPASRLLTAAHLGSIRLIDNIAVE